MVHLWNMAILPTTSIIFDDIIGTVNWHCFNKQIVLHCKCVRYLKKITPQCSPSSGPSDKPNSTLLASILAELTYLCKLFIVKFTRILYIFKADLRNDGTKNMGFCTLDGREYGEQNNVGLMDILYNIWNVRSFILWNITIWQSLVSLLCVLTMGLWVLYGQLFTSDLWLTSSSHSDWDKYSHFHRSSLWTELLLPKRTRCWISHDLWNMATLQEGLELSWSLTCFTGLQQCKSMKLIQYFQGSA